MNSITDIISTKADELFENKDEIIDLETDDETENQKNKEIPMSRCPRYGIPTTTSGLAIRDPELASGQKQDDEKKEDSVENNNEQITHNFKSASQLKSMIHSMKDQLDSMLRLLNNEQLIINNEQFSDNSEILETGERVIEGVFNGEKMVGSDGQEYSVPPNYASKSKLVEGDIMKLTITNNGKFIYKQISPIERERLVGELVSGATGEQWCVLAGGKTYKVLNASITFYKGKPGDEVVFFTAKDGACAWGAVDNIIRKDT